MNIQTIKSRKFGNIRGYVTGNNDAYLSIDDAAIVMRFYVVDINGDKRVMWDFINELLADAGYDKVKAGDFVHERVVYYLAMKSNSPSAKEFQKWIVESVIPTLRKKGSYSTADAKKWQEARKNSIAQRREETDAIKDFIELAQANGDKRPASYFYSQFSMKSNRTAGIPLKGGRNSATVSQIITYSFADAMIAATLKDGMAHGKSPAAIERKVDANIYDIRRIINGASLLSE